MRILAIQGQNLTSLADPFTIDFEAEPIRTAGIFAITGPTGSGKSTLLDAVCLALFDRLPRMDSAERSGMVGRIDGSGGPPLRCDDVKAILRHGAGSGFAQVDFVGQDGRRYRARWEVSRARGRANGTLQQQKLTLRDLETGEVIGDKKTETLAEIERRVGLSFDQFRRSVLLAQGEFDTFIKAPGKERAELLERITGTSVYGQVSKAVFERAKQERQALASFEQQLREICLLDERERAAAEARVVALKEELDLIDARRATLDKARLWHEEKARLDARVAEGEVRQGEAEAAESAAEEDRATLQTVRKALGLRAELEAADESARKLVRARATLEAALEVEREAVVGREHAVAARDAAQAAREEQDRLLLALRPDLLRARHLDGLLEAAQAERVRRSEELEKANREREESSKVLRRAELTVKQTGEEHATNKRWLEEHAAAEALASRIEDVARDLGERLECSAEITITADETRRLDAEIGQLAAARQEQISTLAGLEDQERVLAKGIDAARKVAEEIDRPTVERRREVMQSLRGTLQEATNATVAAGKAAAGTAAAGKARAREEGFIAEAHATLARVAAEMPAAAARLEEAQRNRGLSQAAASEQAEHLRLQLVPGEPCPVCGSVEHLLVEVDRVLKQRVAEDQARVATLEAEITALHGEHAGADARMVAAKQALEDIAARHATCTVELEQACAAWTTAVQLLQRQGEEIDLPIPSLVAEPASAEAAAPLTSLREMLQAMLAEAGDLLDRAGETEAEAARLDAERERVRGQLAATREKITGSRDEEQAKLATQRALSSRLEVARNAYKGAGARLEASLAPAFPNWQEDLAAAGRTFIDGCRQLVEEWRARYQKTNEVAQQLRQLEGELQSRRGAFAALAEAAATAERHHAEKLGEVEELAAQRKALLEGRSADAVEEEQQRALAAAEQGLSEAETLRQAAEQGAAAAASNVAGCRKAVEVAEGDNRASAERLAHKLAACSLMLEEAKAAVEKGEGWSEGEQQRLDRLREALATARATLCERRAAVELHLAGGCPELDLEQVTAALATAKGEREKIELDHRESWSALARDDQNRTRAAGIEATLAKGRDQARVWVQLSDLIGSSDGASFRRFAQSLTLDQLIELANRHLADLHPRYELQRAPEGELVLQVVDRNMADEVRGVHNLSGGERFLVSLALALGLASMSSGQGIRVESLFIDEGFGALDSQSLGLAVSVLEQLQATGRRVGVISHIDELKERIGVKVEVMPMGSGRSTVRVAVA